MERMKSVNRGTILISIPVIYSTPVFTIPVMLCEKYMHIQIVKTICTVVNFPLLCQLPDTNNLQYKEEEFVLVQVQKFQSVLVCSIALGLQQGACGGAQLTSSQ